MDLLPLKCFIFGDILYDMHWRSKLGNPGFCYFVRCMGLILCLDDVVFEQKKLEEPVLLIC